MTVGTLIVSHIRASADSCFSAELIALKTKLSPAVYSWFNLLCRKSTLAPDSNYLSVKNEVSNTLSSGSAGRFLVRRHSGS